MRLKLVLGDKEYVASYADLAKVTIGDLRVVKRETGMSLTDLKAKLISFDTDDDPDVYAALVYLLMSRSGMTVTWADVERIPLVDLTKGFSVVDDDPPVEVVELPADVPVGALVMVDG